MAPNESVAAAYGYTPFGTYQSVEGTISQPYRFSTKRYDDQTGLVLYGYRFYSPATGRWLSRDPLGESVGMNLYGFVWNDPVNWIDPLGLKGGIIRIIRNTLKRNVGADDIVGPIIEWSLNIPMTPIGFFFLVMSPIDAGISDEEYQLYLLTHDQTYQPMEYLLLYDNPGPRFEGCP